MKQLAPNTMIQNRYLVVQPIGKGGMGEVYLAVDQRLGSAVALKRTIFEADNALGNAFEREAKILARLRHPVLPKVIDHFIDGEGQFLVMEHISGDDLAKRLESAAKAFPLSWVMFWADQLLDALNYLHSHEPPIIHRDIKPQNLKLTDDNHIVLLDFGLSKDFDSTPSKANEPPGTGSVVGYSPHFASMEQIRGTGTDARSDLYSMSATLYQLLTNTIPPDALTRADAILGGEDDPIAPINSINAEVTKEISDTILKGLSVRQDQRYANAGEMQKALRRAFNNAKNAPASDDATILNAEPEGSATAILPIPPVSVVDDEIQTVAKIPVTSPAADQTAKIDVPVSVAEPKQSEVQTAIFSTPLQSSAATAGASSAPPTPHQQPARVSSAAPQKKSKIALIIGSLLALMLLGGLAVGGGWYWYSNYYVVKPEATPSPAPSVRPTAEPSPTQLVEANDNVNSSSTPDKTDTTNQRDVTSNPPDRETTTPSTKATPTRTTKTPTAKATPKPKGDDRTVILQ